MCGIAGIVGFEEGREPNKEISAMLCAIARRGPDDEGRYSWSTASFAHRRLAIIDLSQAGHQPMLSDDSEVGLVFNGCVYNFVDLRRELESRGQVFHSHCDTEVILRGYLVWGIHEMVRRLRGMFAFAIWDNRSRKLVMARDRLGVKPLCYVVKDSQLAFASTPAALHAAGFGAEIDPEAVLEYLEFGFVTEEHCIYSGVKKVAPATVIEWQNGKLASSIYWEEGQPVEGSAAISFEDAVDRAESELLEAVSIRLCSDVPVSALLSGGVDSSLVCWALSKLAANFRSYTVSLPGEPEDEAVQAGITAAKLGIPHEKILIPEMGDDTIDAAISAFSEPFAAYSTLAMLQLSQAIKPFATVMLTGDGGDEAFLGYPVHKHSFLAQRVANRIPASSAGLWKALRPALASAEPLRRPRHFMDYVTGGLGAMTQVHDGLPFYSSRELLGSRLAEGNIGPRAIPPSFESARRLLTDVLDYNRKTEFVGEFLTKVDGTTMYYAIEARSPFLDHKLWDFASSLQYSVRLQGGRLKSVLRELVKRRVSPEIAIRPKQGFHLPVGKWLATRWKSRLDNLANGSHLVEQGWIRREALSSVIQQAIDQGNANIHLWRLAVLDAWLAKNASNSRAAFLD